MWLGWGRRLRGKLRVLEHAGCRETGVGSMVGGRGSSESLETPTMLSLSTQFRKQSQRREYTRSVFVSRTASSFSICSSRRRRLRRLRRRRRRRRSVSFRAHARPRVTSDLIRESRDHGPRIEETSSRERRCSSPFQQPRVAVLEGCRAQGIRKASFRPGTSRRLGRFVLSKC